MKYREFWSAVWCGLTEVKLNAFKERLYNQGEKTDHYSDAAMWNISKWTLHSKNL